MRKLMKTMNLGTVTGLTLPDAYHEALKKVWYEGEDVYIENYKAWTREMSLMVEVVNPSAEPQISLLLQSGPIDLRQYEREMIEGIRDFIIGKGPTLWKYTYHDRFKDQLPFVLDLLRRDPSSRQAVIITRHFDIDSEIDDPACLNYIQYFIRNGKLYCELLFRSNDLYGAFFSNAYALIKLQEKVAAELGVEVGPYRHLSTSMHVYDQKDNFEIEVDKIILDMPENTNQIKTEEIKLYLRQLFDCEVRNE